MKLNSNLLATFFTAFCLVGSLHAAEVRVSCYGNGTNHEGTYQVYFNGPISIDEKLSSFQATAKFSMEATGTLKNSQFDIENRFNEVLVEGTVTPGQKGTLTSFYVEGAFLPGGKHLEINFPLQPAQTQTAFSFERQSGGSVLGQLTCQVTLPQQCFTKRVCHQHCHPMVGCDQICRNVTTCEPQKFGTHLE